MNRSVLSVTLLCVALLSCKATDKADHTQVVSGPTLADLALKPVVAEKTEVKQLSLAELNDLYFGLIKDVTDPQVREKLTKRFAVLKMKATEQQQTESVGVVSYKKAIDELTELIDLHPDSPANELLWYQLAKLYELDGNAQFSLMAIEAVLGDFPNSEYRQEMEFRRAEIMFSTGDYYQAIAGYEKVLATPEQGSYQLTARYMLGWSYFKLEQYPQALTIFNRILDKLIPANIIASVTTGEDLLSKIVKKDRQLVKETFDIMSLVFANINKPEAIAQHYRQIGHRPYQFLHYDFLGQYYLQKKRYSDSYAVYHAFVMENPYHVTAPFYSQAKLNALRQAKFNQQLAQESVAFVHRYLPNSDYWQPTTKVNEPLIAPMVYQMILELAQNAHAKAQDERGKSKQSEQNTAISAQLAGYYREAIDWYLLVLANYPTDAKARETRFYLAESYFELQDYAQAASTYQQVAYPDNETITDEDKFAAEAAYGLILSLEQQHKLAVSNAKAPLFVQLLAAQNRFVDTFVGDSRRLSVLHQLFEQYFASQQYELAIEKANFALTIGKQFGQTQQQQVAALFVIGDSFLRQQEYQAAETYFDQILALIDQQSSYYADVIELLSVSVFQQGEQLLQAATQAMAAYQQVASTAANAQQLDAILQQQQNAISHFHRLVKKAPSTSLAIKAKDVIIATEYDMATQYLNLQHWDEAERRLIAFARSYPTHKLAQDIDTKLAFAYQESGQLDKAAEKLVALWQQAPKSEHTKEFLWLAANYYRQLGDAEQAIITFRDYAHTYPEPFERSIEAKFTMSELYLETEQPIKRNYWLNKLIDAEKTAGSNSSVRSRYLAAMSSIFFADEAMAKFKRVKLTLPLAKSLKKKKSLLDQAVKSYNQTTKYQVAEYTTQANFKLADVYRQLAADLLASARPKGLSALELEQYDILLEEQAYPFEDQAIAVHEINAKRSYQGVYDQWVQQSFAELSTLLPARYLKEEVIAEVADGVY